MKPKASLRLDLAGIDLAVPTLVELFAREFAAKDGVAFVDSRAGYDEMERTADEHLLLPVLAKLGREPGADVKEEDRAVPRRGACRRPV